jgi:hypothetical protein
MQLERAARRPTTPMVGPTDWWDGVKGGFQQERIVDVGR